MFLNLSRDAICELVEAKFAFVFLRDAARSQLWSKVETTNGHYSILRWTSFFLLVLPYLTDSTPLPGSLPTASKTTNHAVLEYVKQPTLNSRN